MTVTDDEEQGAGAVPERPGRAAGRLPRRRPSAPPTPAARFEPGRVAESRHRNPTWIVAGVLLVVLSALGGVLLFTSRDDRTEVLVAAGELQPGQAVTRGDLRIQRVALEDGVASMSATAVDDVVGRHPIGRVPAGTLLSPAMFAEAVPLGPDEVVVGAALDPGEAPLSMLEVGAAVELIEVTLDEPGATPLDGSTPGAPGASAASLGTGVVWAVEPIATGQLWVSVRVPRDLGIAASLASAEDRLRLALIGGGG